MDRRSRVWLLMLLAALPAGCAGPFHGLGERTRRLRGSLEGVPPALREELERPHAALAAAGHVVDTVPLSGILEVPAFAGELGGQEMRRPHRALETAAGFHAELARPARVFQAGGLLPGHLGQEAGRVRASMDHAARLLGLEFERRLTRDPRRGRLLPDPEGAVLLPRPLAYPQALALSLPIW